MGAAAGILFAPEKGVDTRARICKLLHDKGIQLKKEDNLSLVGNQTYYDIQDTSRWTLQHFHSYLQAKRDTHVIKNFANHFALEDSIHHI